MDVSFLLPVLADVLLGIVLGLVGGMLGIGGGLIAIPILGYLYGMDQHLAQGTALVMIAPNLLVGFLRYHQRHRIDLRAVAAMSALSMLATFVAARFAARIPAPQLHVAFAAFLIVLGVYFMWEFRARARVGAAERPVPAKALALLGIICGAMSGLFTIGGVLIVVPALVTLYGMKQTRAQGVALALVVPGAFIALGTYAHAGHVDWRVGVALAAGGLASVSAGVALAHRFSPLALRAAFCAVLLAAGVGMLLT
ncbi:sulfite exporter TauE/SafE family protein [Massilia sp. R2A-15]|uniref:sulfite exporter TauE/SafE family protein n=1 Tax=Massilia sp. R2A-15 TaxID=3064278 RepID=UPI002732E48F|nr:sulfite exporter TauE/SafE family protein [Massilia sp. R2A-15]WLI89559.1 sulfite exporter TauE/SafE family protein [Massilia sp. R2A-15]